MSDKGKQQTKVVNRIVIAVDSFKHCLSSLQVAEILERELLAINPDLRITKIPIADGGEGTIEALVSSTKGRIVYCDTYGPLLKPLRAPYGVLGDKKTAAIEMAVTCGLGMVEGQDKNPWHTTTYGMGDQIKQALTAGYRRFIIGIGGGCVNDGGLGLLQALGFIFADSSGKELERGGGGKQLSQLCSIDMTKVDKRLADCEFIVASDVSNPLHGSNGAAYVYGPQKGADPTMVKLLDEGLINYGRVIKETIGVDFSEVKGAGAAGGCGAGLMAFLNAVLIPGIEIVLRESSFKQLLNETDLVITGEGKLDYQTLSGKVPLGIAAACSDFAVSTIAVAGRVELTEKEVLATGIEKTYEVSPAELDLDEAFRLTEQNLALVVHKIAADYGLHKRITKPAKSIIM